MSGGPASSRRVLLVTSDLFFATRIRTAAAHLGIDVDEASAEPATAGVPDLVIVDLGAPGAVDTIRHLRRRPDLTSVPIVAYGSHVERPLLDAARAAGADPVLPRSAFTARLPELLQGRGA